MVNAIQKKQLKIFLEGVSVMSIAVCLDNKPMSSVVLFTVDNDLSFYFLTKRNTYKAKALRSNPQISISIWVQNNKLIQASGEVMEISGDAEFDKYYKKLSSISDRMQNAYWPFTAVKGEESVVYKVFTKWLRVMDLSSDGKDNPFYTVELEKSMGGSSFRSSQFYFIA